MKESLKKIECEPVCGFMVRGHDERELLDIAQAHAKKAHNIVMPENEMKKFMKPA